MMASTEAALAEAYQRYGRGDFAGAERLGRQLLPALRNNGALAGLLGMVALQDGRIEEAVPHLRIAFRDTPTSIPLRINLAFALTNIGQHDEARRLASGHDIPALRRIVAFVDQRQGKSEAAIAGYRKVLADFPQDYESWNNLGLLLSEAGEIDGAIEAFDRALALNRQSPFYVNRSRALARGERHPERQAMMRDILHERPDEVLLLVEAGLAEGAQGDFASAEAAYRRALLIDPGHAPAYLEYGMLLESLNRLGDLEALVADARRIELDGQEVAFIEAWLLKRKGRFAEALSIAESIGDGINPSRHAQLLGDVSDRLGQADRAFDAFARMNHLSAQGPAAAYARAQDFPSQVGRTIDLLTPARIERWSPVNVATDSTAPIFVVGFPRSGTTLLDTLLMNLPELEILEEQPIVERVEAMSGGAAAIATLSTDKADRLRQAYFEILGDMRAAPEGGAIIVDKHPLHIVRAALIQRIFPDSPFIFVERHPCDVVLSCFMSRFQTNQATVQFHDLMSAARLYDLAMQAWQRAADLLPLRVHRIRYERMVGNVRGEMQGLLNFLELPWRDEVLDNHVSAARRTHIATASYAQVTEPIYTRATGRWQRYRRHLEPVLPILAPWVERMGYTLDDENIGIIAPTAAP